MLPLVAVVATDSLGIYVLRRSVAWVQNFAAAPNGCTAQTRADHRRTPSDASVAARLGVAFCRYPRSARLWHPGRDARLPLGRVDMRQTVLSDAPARTRAT